MGEDFVLCLTGCEAWNTSKAFFGRHLHIVCKVFLKSCADSTTGVWVVILTALGRHPNSRPGLVQKEKTLNLSGNPHIFWLFQSVLNHHYACESFCIKKSHWNQSKCLTKGICTVVWATWTTETPSLALQKSVCPVASNVSVISVWHSQWCAVSWLQGSCC